MSWICTLNTLCSFCVVSDSANPGPYGVPSRWDLHRSHGLISIQSLVVLIDLDRNLQCIILSTADIGFMIWNFILALYIVQSVFACAFHGGDIELTTAPSCWTKSYLQHMTSFVMQRNAIDWRGLCPRVPLFKDKLSPISLFLWFCFKSPSFSTVLKLWRPLQKSKTTYILVYRST